MFVLCLLFVFELFTEGDVQNELEVGYDTVVSVSDNAPVAFREMFDAWGTDLRNISMTKNGESKLEISSPETHLIMETLQRCQNVKKF